MSERYYLPIEIVDRNNNGDVTGVYIDIDGREIRTSWVNNGIQSSEIDSRSEKLLETIRYSFTCENELRENKFGTTSFYNFLKYPADKIIEMYEKCVEFPKPGDIYIARTKQNTDLDDAKRVVLWVDKLSNVHYVLEAPTVVFINYNNVQAFLADNVKDGTVEDFNKYFEHIYSRKINY